MTDEMKVRRIEKRLDLIEDRLATAEEYLTRGVNVEGRGFLHFDDWQGKSGHPLWIRNHMIPATIRHRAKKERALRNIERKAKDKGLARRKRNDVE